MPQLTKVPEGYRKEKATVPLLQAVLWTPGPLPLPGLNVAVNWWVIHPRPSAQDSRHPLKSSQWASQTSEKGFPLTGVE